jgi:hypothetical protein
MKRFLLTTLFIIGVIFVNLAVVSVPAEAIPGAGIGFFFDAPTLSFTSVVRVMLGSGIAGLHLDIMSIQSASLTFIPSLVFNAPFTLAPGIMVIPYIGIGPVIRIPPAFVAPYLQAKIGDLLSFYGFGMYIELAFNVIPLPLGFQGVGFGVTANF